MHNPCQGLWAYCDHESMGEKGVDKRQNLCAVGREDGDRGWEECSAEPDLDSNGSIEDLVHW